MAHMTELRPQSFFYDNPGMVHQEKAGLKRPRHDTSSEWLSARDYKNAFFQMPFATSC